MVSPVQIISMYQLKNTMFNVVFIIALILVGCEKHERRVEPYQYTELAMSENMVIDAKNKYGVVRIEWKGPLERCFAWEEKHECRTLIPRKERYNGRLGAYDPAETFFWELFTTRIVSEDSKINFENMQDMKLWLIQGSSVFDWVYTDDGLVIGFSKSTERNQINIYVYQLLVNNKKPTEIDGSRPENIKISILK